MHDHPASNLGGGSIAFYASLPSRSGAALLKFKQAHDRFGDGTELPTPSPDLDEALRGVHLLTHLGFALRDLEVWQVVAEFGEVAGRVLTAHAQSGGLRRVGP